MNSASFTTLIFLLAANQDRYAAAKISDYRYGFCPVGWYAATKTRACYTSVYVAKGYETDYFTAAQRCAAEHPNGHLPYFYNHRDYTDFKRFLKTIHENKLFKTWVYSSKTRMAQHRPKLRNGKPPNLYAHNREFFEMKDGQGRCALAQKNGYWKTHICDKAKAFVTCQVYRGTDHRREDNVKAKKVRDRITSGEYACPEGWYVAPAGFCYKILMNDNIIDHRKVDRYQASVDCTMEHTKAVLPYMRNYGRLVMFKRYVMDFNKNKILAPIWLQATDLMNEGIWLDDKGHQLNFTGGWASGHPKYNKKDDCMVASKYDHRFHEVSCNKKKIVACQLMSHQYISEEEVDDSKDVCPVGWYTGMTVCIKMPFFGATMKMSHSRGMAECKRLHPRAFLPMFRNFIEWNQFTTFLKLTKMHKTEVWIGARAIPRVIYDIAGNISSDFPGFSNWKVGKTTGLYDDGCFVRQDGGQWADMDCNKDMSVICMVRKEDVKYRERPMSKCPNGWFSIEGSCLLPPYKGNWKLTASKFDAEKECFKENARAHLPYFLNRKEYVKFTDFRRHIMKSEATFKDLWLNGNDDDVAADFRLDYGHGLRIRYAAFYPGMPRSTTSYQCISDWYARYSLYKYNGNCDDACGTLYSYICQMYDLEYFEKSVAYSLQKHRSIMFKRGKTIGRFDLTCLIRMTPLYGGSLAVYGITSDQYYGVYKHDVPDYEIDPKCKENAGLLYLCFTLCESICHTNLQYIGCDVTGNKCNCSGGLGCGDSREWNKVYTNQDIGEAIEGNCMKCQNDPAICLSSVSEIQAGKKGKKFSNTKSNAAFMLRVKK